jgi:hypothetical protein
MGGLLRGALVSLVTLRRTGGAGIDTGGTIFSISLRIGLQRRRIHPPAPSLWDARLVAGLTREEREVRASMLEREP